MLPIFIEIGKKFFEYLDILTNFKNTFSFKLYLKIFNLY